MEGAKFGAISDIDECRDDGVCRATYQSIYDLIVGRGVQITLGEAPRWPAAN